MKINNRRYIGSKTKLLKLIEKTVLENLESKDYSKLVFADLFAGTGVVAENFAKKGFKVIVNDILYSNFIAYKTWLNDQPYSTETISNYLDYYNNLCYDNLEDNYFSNIYGGKYFSINDAKKIGFIRDHIESVKNNLNEREYFILISILMYTADKIANTVGHFEHYLSKEAKDSNFNLNMAELENYSDIKIYNEDSNELVKKIKTDIAYIDPPYNARQYINFYHVLENLARWNKPTEFEGKSMKFKRNELKSGYSKAIASNLFKDLIDNLDSKLIIVSYNNTYTAKSVASNNKISEEQIIEILAEKGNVTKKEISYKSFNSGKTNFKNHKEFLFICEVKK